MRFMLKSKIHRATVTGADINYVGSITIDPELLEAADIIEYEQVHVVDINNGERLVTYVIAGRPGSGEVVLNGAAARLVSPGDLVIIISYDMLEESQASRHKPKIVLVDERNRIVPMEQSTA